jgi:hypothetical protein
LYYSSIGRLHIAVGQLDHVPDHLVVSACDLTKERAVMKLTYSLRRARFDGNVSWFNVARQIELYPALIYDGASVCAWSKYMLLFLQ